MASQGFLSFVMDHNGSGGSASAVTPIVVHPGARLSNAIKVLRAWFVSRTLYEEWVALPETALRSLFWLNMLGPQWVVGFFTLVSPPILVHPGATRRELPLQERVNPAQSYAYPLVFFFSRGQ